MTDRKTGHVDRRSVLAGLGAGLGTYAAGGVRLSLAAGPGDKRFVLVLLRGGMDGLALVPPYGDDDYVSQRGALAIPGSGKDDGVIDLDGFHGLHPAASALLPFWQRQEMLVVPAAATPYRGRSHLDAQRVLENGSATPDGAEGGWLNRALGLLGDGTAPAVAVSKTMPLVLAGLNETSIWPSQNLPQPITGYFEKVALLYSGDLIFAPLLAEGLRQKETRLSRLPEDDSLSGRGAWRPQDLEYIATMAAENLRAEQGSRIAVLETGGWDTHQDQGSVNGVLARRLSGLSGALSAMAVAMGPAWSDTVVAVVGEFGRSVTPNATRGTDNGVGGAMLLLGGAVAGGRFVGGWPGLSTSDLVDGAALKPVTDTRSVFASILVDHFGMALAGVQKMVFPGIAGGGIQGLIR